MKRIIGKWDSTGNGSREYKIYLNDDEYNVTYPNATLDLSFNEVMENWAVILNSPWSDHDAYYRIEKNATYKRDFIGCPDYICIFWICGYGHMTASLYGYGDNPIEALEDCINRFDYIQQTYNPDDESM